MIYVFLDVNGSIFTLGFNDLKYHVSLPGVFVCDILDLNFENLCGHYCQFYSFSGNARRSIVLSRLQFQVDIKLVTLLSSAYSISSILILDERKTLNPIKKITEFTQGICLWIDLLLFLFQLLSHQNFLLVIACSQLTDAISQLTERFLPKTM